MSTEGVQQGDPLGPLFFCLSVHRQCASLKSLFCVMYLDDMTIGGDLENIFERFECYQESHGRGAALNNEESKIICEDATVRGTILCALPGAQVILPEEAPLLGSPIGGIASIDASLKEKTKAMCLMGARFKHMSSHDSLILLRHSFAIPRLQYR